VNHRDAVAASSLPKIKLKKAGGRRFKEGHPWVFSNELEEVPKLSPGTLVSLSDAHGKFLAIGYFNPKTLISFRLLTKKENLGPDFLLERIEKAVISRKEAYPLNEAARVVFGESDSLPGLVIDDFKGAVVIQILTAGMENFKDAIVKSADALLDTGIIFLKNDSSMRVMEGLPKENIIAKGSETLIKTTFSGLFFEFDLARAQKTGLFLDQRENLKILSSFDFKGKKALDLFTYFGCWGMTALKNGAEKTLFVDSSRYALETAEKALALSSLNGGELMESNVFDYLPKLHEDGERFDFIFSDPPAFAKSAKHVNEAYKAYRRLNEMCMKLASKDGTLVASSCSYNMSQELFLESLKEAAARAKRDVRFLFWGRQSLDHPISLSFPESNYLKCAFLKIL
jgi:23S rRNA (cytosine1962-C5)-methyltransferase